MRAPTPLLSSFRRNVSLSCGSSVLRTLRGDLSPHVATLTTREAGRVETSSFGRTNRPTRDGVKGSPALAINSSLRETKIHRPTMHRDPNNRPNYILSLPCLSLSLFLSSVCTYIRRSTKRTKSRTVDRDGNLDWFALGCFQ